jgi:hypothetical protein
MLIGFGIAMLAFELLMFISGGRDDDDDDDEPEFILPALPLTRFAPAPSIEESEK